ncbi:hemerythrin domain-containing protein [Sphingomonas aerolata]|uniref:hemerythrin domain-containing protein n=1 Tax=Sphingomonas aerolata TaxID=185951 RepID=UPI002FE0615F
MDITQLILDEHAQQRALFAQIDSIDAKDTEALSALWTRLKNLLDAHAEAEERFLYPGLMKIGTGGNDADLGRRGDRGRNRGSQRHPRNRRSGRQAPGRLGRVVRGGRRMQQGEQRSPRRGRAPGPDRLPQACDAGRAARAGRPLRGVRGEPPERREGRREGSRGVRQGTRSELIHPLLTTPAKAGVQVERWS